MFVCFIHIIRVKVLKIRLQCNFHNAKWTIYVKLANVKKKLINIKYIIIISLIQNNKSI